MDLNSFAKTIYHYLVSNDYVSEQAATYINAIGNLFIALILGFILYKILRYIALTIIHQLAKRTKTSFDDLLVKNKVFVYLTDLIVLFIIYETIPAILIDFPDFEIYLEKIFQVAMIFISIMIIRSILLTIKDFLRTYDSFKDKPLESYIQVFMIVIWLVGIIFLFSAIIGKPLLKFLTALGAFSAVLLLIFKDTILGFVASIQVTVNDTVRLGDWITMQKYGADGDVIEINLASVKVRNFDKTITTIPTYYLISDSFINWRGMSVSGGRRMKRSILIKANSIKFLTEADIEQFQKIKLISKYIKDKQQEIQSYNEGLNIDKSMQLNGRNQTNLGAFRVYIDHYLEQHPDVNKEMLMMTRQLPATPQGIPLEIYAFSKDKVWSNYERILAGIFDHLLAAVPFFDLECFEYPSGQDVKSMSRHMIETTPRSSDSE
jgi:miniconductance mechanosensitive channel